MKVKNRLAVFGILLLVFSSFGASEVVVNSQDWRDNALAISYSHFTGQNVRMVTSLGEGQLISKSLSKNSTHTVFSSGNPVWSDYSVYLENNGHTVETRGINWSQDQYDLYSQVSDEVEGFVVVKPDYGFNTISVFPKVVNGDYWLLYYEGKETVEFLKGRNKPVMFYGEYLDQPWLSLDTRTEVLSTGSMPKNNKKIVRRQFSRQGSDSVVIAGDSYIEKGFLKKGRPILLSQGLETTVQIIEEYNTSIVEVIGAENVNFGNSIKDRLGDQVSVIAKFGRKFTGLKGLQDTYPIKKFPVTQVRRNVTLENVSVDIGNGSDVLRMIYSNNGNIPVEVRFSAAELVFENSQNQLVSQPREILVRPGASSAITVRANISSQPSEASVSFDYRGKTGLQTQDYPVYSTDIQGAKVTLQDLYYVNPDDLLVAEVKNTGDSTVWVDAELKNLSILNRTEDVLPESRKRLASGEKKKLIYDVRLTDEQIQSNQRLDVNLYAGSEEPLMERRISNVELRVSEQSITGSFMSDTAPLLLAGALILVLLLFEWRTSGISSYASRLRQS